MDTAMNAVVAALIPAAWSRSPSIGCEKSRFPALCIRARPSVVPLVPP